VVEEVISMRAILLCSLAAFAWAADKKPILPAKASNDTVAFEAKAHLTKEEVFAAVGSSLEEGFIVVDITLTPKNGQKVKIYRDDFTLFSSKDGQRSTPYSPTQIAGQAGLVISSKQAGGGVMAQERRVPWGLGGGGIGGMPGNGGSMGSSTGGATIGSASTIDTDPKKGPDPLLAVLESKILPEKTIEEPITGQLYFLIEGKVKLKDLQLFYKAPGGRLTAPFVR
jgi:hypothetical protein